MKNFIANMLALHGEAGRAWLDSLPETISFLARKWHIDALQRFPNLTYHYVLAGTRSYRQADDQQIVLKIGFDRAVVQQEAAALQAFGGQGCVKLLAHDDAHGALLVEWLIPGTTLSTYFPAREKESVKIASNIIEQMHHIREPDLTKFPTVESWLLTLDKSWDIPQKQLNKARLLRDQLLATAANPILLHGDLHHDNILFDQARNSWCAIDPKGVVGESVYDLGTFVRNPDSLLRKRSHAEQIIKTRIDLLAAQLNLDAARIRNWGFVQSVMAACWDLEDGGKADNWLAIANVFDRLW